MYHKETAINSTMGFNEIQNFVNDYAEEIGTNLNAGEIVSLFLFASLGGFVLFVLSHLFLWILKVFLGIYWILYCILLAYSLIRVVHNKLRRKNR